LDLDILERLLYTNGDSNARSGDLKKMNTLRMKVNSPGLETDFKNQYKPFKN